MKLTQLITEGNMYTAYVLTDAAREKLVEKFPPKYEKFIGHHITIQFGVPKDTEAPDPGLATRYDFAFVSFSSAFVWG